MNWHERARAAVDRPTVAICHHCAFGLFKYQPERMFDTLRAESNGPKSPAHQRAGE